MRDAITCAENATYVSALDELAVSLKRVTAKAEGVPTLLRVIQDARPVTVPASCVPPVAWRTNICFCLAYFIFQPATKTEFIVHATIRPRRARRPLRDAWFTITRTFVIEADE